MYSEWSSFSNQVENPGAEAHSVLHVFKSNVKDEIKYDSSLDVGRQVCLAVVKPLAQDTGLTKPSNPSPSSLKSAKDVKWCMEVLCYGLCLPISEHDIIRDCVYVYCEWLSSLHESPDASIPLPIKEDPNFFSQKILYHFYNIFVPRAGEADQIHKQAVLCHRILRTLQDLVQKPNKMNNETWECLLLFLISINDSLLGPPSQKDDVGDQLCDRVLSVLFEIWIISCCKCFPSPSLWKTLQEMCMKWRHRVALIDQWNRTNVALTARLLKVMYGSNFPDLNIECDDAKIVPRDMSDECIVQTWFRIIKTIGNPVDLANTDIIGRTPKFVTYTLNNKDMSGSQYHPCLEMLPNIFLKAMKGVACVCDALLGIGEVDRLWPKLNFSEIADDTIEVDLQPTTPPSQRRGKLSFDTKSILPTSHKGLKMITPAHLSSARLFHNFSLGSQSPSLPLPAHQEMKKSGLVPMVSIEMKMTLNPDRPRCDSILNLFGAWLFEALLLGCDASTVLRRSQRSESVSGRSNSVLMERKGMSTQMSMGEVSEIPDPEHKNFDEGQAEAAGALCRIFCSKKTDEDINPVFLARFYHCVSQGLQRRRGVSNEIVASIIVNSSNLFRLDLDGVNILLPVYLTVMEGILSDKEPKFRCRYDGATIRRSCVQILLSIVTLPLHYSRVTIRDFGTDKDPAHILFIQLKPRLVTLLINALQTETESVNTQMLLGGLLLSVQDSVVFEELEEMAVQHDAEEGSLPLTTSSEGEDDESGTGSDDSSYHLWLKAIYITCHSLISNWKNDFAVSLAALELLSGLAAINMSNMLTECTLECMRAVKWICDYIVKQCQRPPPQHSKDLHSTIVSAYYCLVLWLLHHPHLLEDKDCLNTVLETVELGLSGSKSHGREFDAPVMKDTKEMKPASIRVRDAAENLLYVITTQVGHFPSPCGSESMSSLLDEVTLLRHCHMFPSDPPSIADALKHFKYFVFDNSIILGVLEQPLGNHQDPQPTVTVILRGPFGRHAWTMELRHLPRHKSGLKLHSCNPGRPIPMTDMGEHYDYQPKTIPDNVDKIPPCLMDSSIPSLEAVISEAKLQEEHDSLGWILDQQIQLEQNIAKSLKLQDSSEYPNPATECRPPSLCQEYQTARLFLSHFGFLSPESLLGTGGRPPQLVALDCSQEGYSQDLDELDSLSCRTFDTVHIFYVKDGQKTIQEILSNTGNVQGVSVSFLEFLHSLGWGVDVDKHPGWTGHVDSSWRILTADPGIHKEGDMLYDGQTHVLYWANTLSEIAFVVPSLRTSMHRRGSHSSSLSIDTQAGDIMVPSEEYYPPVMLQGDSDQVTTTYKQKDKAKRKSKAFSVSSCYEMKILVVWLESYEDHLTLPLDDVLLYCNTGLEDMASSRKQDKETFIIYLHSLQSGLIRVHLENKYMMRNNLVTPLIDGMVVSKRVLGSLVRQTAINMNRRRRLECEKYELGSLSPQGRRRAKIQDLVKRYSKFVSDPEFYCYLFESCAS